jgi:pre-mRNA-splicing factor 38A
LFSGRHRGAREMDYRRKSEKSKRDKERDKDRDKDKERDRKHRDRDNNRDGKRDGGNNADSEIAEANALRAKLGLPPLK